MGNKKVDTLKQEPME